LRYVVGPLRGPGLARDALFFEKEAEYIGPVHHQRIVVLLCCAALGF